MPNTADCTLISQRTLARAVSSMRAPRAALMFPSCQAADDHSVDADHIHRSCRPVAPVAGELGGIETWHSSDLSPAWPCELRWRPGLHVDADSGPPTTAQHNVVEWFDQKGDARGNERRLRARYRQNDGEMVGPRKAIEVAMDWMDFDAHNHATIMLPHGPRARNAAGLASR
jgi:hypothetical protein